ncbi:MAG TPA: AbrB family transcriptional regulator [Xanthobacteraceae bacterium]|nr:AbrB family transcriptional regulator [Xanthobacteraceae bacterium]
MRKAMLSAFLPPALREPAETLAIALAGAVTFTLLGFPAGLVSGSVLAVATAALFGRPAKVPVSLARVGYVVVGILLGAVVTPQTLQGFTTWPLSIALLLVAAVCMMLATTSYLRVVHRWDRLTALLGASPGSMVQVIALSTELGADLRAIAIVQTTRVLLLTIGIPGGLALFGLVAPAVPMVRGDSAGFSPPEIAVVIAVSSAAAFAMARIRFPGGFLFGAMAGSAVLHGTGLVTAVLPWWVGSASVIVLGAVVGSRFANTTFRLLVGYLGAAFGSFAVSVSIATMFAVLVTNLFPLSIANVVVAFSPGAQDTMMVLALALHLDPVFIGAHHVARFLVVTFTVAIAARWIAKKEL